MMRNRASSSGSGLTPARNKRSSRRPGAARPRVCGTQRGSCRLHLSTQRSACKHLNT